MTTAKPSPREQYEARIGTVRNPWAVSESDSGGRKHPEPAHPYRTCFQRDRDRVVHCSAFRRLDYKTQVFVPHEDDHFRTRLTHSLEVAQIARDIARGLQLNEDLTEVVALAHDLGHPPFGHAGEEALDELMADHGGFEHNRQSLRVVDYLEHPYPLFRGLNLTEVVRECLARHQTRYDRPACEEFPPGLMSPLEGQIVDLADEIAWTSADLEDALACGLLSVEQVSALKIWQRAWRSSEAACPDARPIHKRIRATKAVLAIMADDVIETTRSAVAAERIASLDDVRKAGRRLVDFSEDTRSNVAELQELLHRAVYTSKLNADHAVRARAVIRELFEAYVANPALLPNRYRERVDSSRAMPLQRVVCDYIAGMTDRFCRQQHATILG